MTNQGHVRIWDSAITTGSKFWPRMVRTLPLLLLFISTVSVPAKDGEFSAAIGAPRLPEVKRAAFNQVIYLNGQNTEADDAKRDAGLIAARINCGVHLIYNDLTLPVIDWFSTLIEKAGDVECSVNAATKTLVSAVQRQIEKGEEVHVIGHSAGSLSIHNAVRAIAAAYKSKSPTERQLLLSRVHVLTVGGATFSQENVFADEWPPIGSLHHLWDERDGIASVWGEGDFWDWFDCDMGDYHGMGTHYVKHLKPSMLRESGKTIIKP